MLAAVAAKSVAYRTGLHRILFYRYDYMFRPSDLAFLVRCVSDTNGMPGPLVEIGCAAGNTTVFLNKHLDDLDDDRDYVCIDTFAGFTEDDIVAELGRGKDPQRYEYLFRAYRKEWFDRTMSNNDIRRARSIKADANEFDFTSLEEVSFCLIDVDLRRPVERSLEAILPRMAQGGIIVVDDCAPDNKFDGALAAYEGVLARHGLTAEIVNGVLGVIRVSYDG
jgi:predicted O-methyltransferase YrrM